MKKIQVEITGVTPLLMNSPKGMLLKLTDSSVSSKREKRDIKKEAEGVAYRTSKGKLYVPSTAIQGCILNASSYKKSGKYSLKPILAGAVRIEPEEILLNTNTYEIDLRSVVIQRARIIKARPKIADWKLNFTLIYNDNLIQEHDIIKQCLQEGGERVGILDFRPQKTGSFGMFEVTKWKPIK